MEHGSVNARGQELLGKWDEPVWVETVHRGGLLPPSCYNIDDYYHYTESPGGLSSCSIVPMIRRAIDIASVTLYTETDRKQI